MPLIKSRRVPLPVEPFSGVEIVHAYNHHAHRYMLPVYRHLARRIAQKASRSGCKVLEIGTGSGLLAMELAGLDSLDLHITAIDLSPDMLRIARNNMDQAGLSSPISFVLASGAAIPFNEGSFDIVVSNASLHHWAKPLEILSEVKRVTAKGGFCVIRDNMRLPPIGSPVIDIVSLFKGMTKNERDLWVRAINAGYSLKEARELIRQSAINYATVKINPTFLDLQIEWTAE
jgi:ubiquinone/menaquinone biosynthesis C-methylase UbiE